MPKSKKKAPEVVAATEGAISIGFPISKYYRQSSRNTAAFPMLEYCPDEKRRSLSHEVQLISTTKNKKYCEEKRKNACSSAIKTCKTALQENASIKSDLLFDSPQHPLKRRSSRYRKKSKSTFLNDAIVVQIYHALAASVKLRAPINRMVTIHWERSGISADHAVRATVRFLKYIRDLLSKRNLPFAYIWVRENDFDDSSRGDHVHVLMHIPNEASVGKFHRRWVRKISGSPYKKGVINTRCIAGLSNAIEISFPHYMKNLLTAGAYISKGCTKTIAKQLGFNRWGDGGYVLDKRNGMSRNLYRAIIDHQPQQH